LIPAHAVLCLKKDKMNCVPFFVEDKHFVRGFSRGNPVSFHFLHSTNHHLYNLSQSCLKAFNKIPKSYFHVIIKRRDNSLVLQAHVLANLVTIKRK